MKHALTVTLCLMLMGCPVVTSPQPGPQPAPVVKPLSELQKEMQALCVELEPLSHPELARFYRDFADVIERDDEIIRSTGDIREAHQRAGRLAFQKTGLQEKTPGLAAQIDSVFAAALTLRNVPLTPDVREKAVELCRAIGSALE